MEIHQALRLAIEGAEKALQHSSAQLQEKGTQSVRLGFTFAYRFEAGQMVIATSREEGVHEISIELLREALPFKHYPAPPQAPVEVPVEALLVELLGEPGFNSSARAAIFLEVVQEYSTDQMLAVAKALSESKSPNAKLKRPHHLLGNLIRSGPMKNLVKGSDVLGRIANQANQRALAEILLRVWKTEEDWL